MQLEKLDDPFSSTDIEWRVQQCGVKDGKPWVMVLAYVTNRAIMSRLDEVCGKERWSNVFKPAPDGGVMCGLSIKIDDEWITKWDAAENTDIEAVKGGFSGSMKRAGVQWGIGRYLYNLESGFAKCSTAKVSGWNKTKTKANVNIYWQTPTLPNWALPATQFGTEPQHEQEQETPDNTLEEHSRSFDDVLADFTAFAYDCTSIAELQKVYKETWARLAESSEHKDKAIDVYKLSLSDLKAKEA